MSWRGIVTRSSGEASPRDGVVGADTNTILGSRGEQRLRGRYSEQVLRPTDPAERLSSVPSSAAGPSPLGQELRSNTSSSSSEESQRRREVRHSTSLQTQAAKNHRFSLLRLRHASDPQLSASYASARTTPPPTLPTPTIIKTSPTANSVDHNAKKKTKHHFFGRTLSTSRESLEVNHPPPADRSTQSLGNSQNVDGTTRKRFISFEEPRRLSALQAAPPAYEDHSSSSLALPVSRLSESSRSDGSSGDHRIYAQTTTTHTISTTTTFFRLPRRNKDKGPLFPLPVRVPPPDAGLSVASRTPRGSISGRPSLSSNRGSSVIALRPTEEVRDEDQEENPSPMPSPTHSAYALTNAPLGSPGPTIHRKDSARSHGSARSSPSRHLPPPRAGQRGRSSTIGSVNKRKDSLKDSPQLLPSGRTSTSTIGRKSIGDLFSLSHRLRHNSEPPRNGSGGPGTPVSPMSKPNSFQIQREPSYPDRTENDTPASYLEKLEAAVTRGVMATILCKNTDDFSKTCLRKYMRGFSYFGDSVDIAIRKMLMEVELPKETQQIDRLLQGFADRYCECNPGIFVSVDEAYFVAFSILLLHSDTHNKNNKHKMQKQDYVKNTQDQVEVSHEILECFYENVSYTPFIHFEDEVAINSHRLGIPKPRKSVFQTPSKDNLRGPVDPYSLILDSKLDLLRPPLKEVMDTEDTYSSTGTSPFPELGSLYHAFSNAGILQIVSARSRPGAFMNQATISNPAEAQAGLVDIKAAKIGLLWRKDPKKKKTKSPWQEWGAILTSSQLYCFRNVTWIKSLISQQDAHPHKSTEGSPLIFKPPLNEFKPDALMSMDDAVALLDHSYKKHKNGFVFIKHGGFEEVFLANTESELNDWIAKLNFAATFRTTGVRMRTDVAAANHGSHYRALRRETSHASTRTVQVSPTSAPFNGYKIDQYRDYENLAHRLQLMKNKVVEADEKLVTAQKELDHLLRNARHLQVLLPIQNKTREAVVLAAGAMSARLKWTRVEMWRIRCHRDILKLDIDAEARAVSTQSLVQPSLASTNSQKPSPLRLGHLPLTKSESWTIDVAVSPTTMPSIQFPRSPSQAAADRSRKTEITQHPLSPEVSNLSRHRSLNSTESAAVSEASTELMEEMIQSLHHHNQSHNLDRPLSTSTSYLGRTEADSRRTTPTRSFVDSEELLLREAGLIGADGTVASKQRPTTSDSERDHVGTIFADTAPRDRGASVRRSLQRTFRESHHGPHFPHHGRSKKGRDSNTSISVNDDGMQAIVGEADGLSRGSGSFIVHGKKASVITFGSDWQAMSKDDRRKVRKQAQTDPVRGRVAEDGTESNMSASSSMTEGSMGQDHSSIRREGGAAKSTDEEGASAAKGKMKEEELEAGQGHETTPLAYHHSVTLSDPRQAMRHTSGAELISV